MSAARITALETELALLRRELGAAQERLQAIEAREARRAAEAPARSEGRVLALEAGRAREGGDRERP